jgi:hypothetical protein
MGIFDAIQNAISGVTDAVQNGAGDLVGGLADNQVVQDVQEHATTAIEGATDVAAPIIEQGQTAVEDITQRFGL